MIKAIMRKVTLAFFGGFIQSALFALMMCVILTRTQGDIKEQFRQTINGFKIRSNRFRLYFYFYLYLLYNITVFSRACLYSPLSDVFGGWKVHMTQYNGLTFDISANILLFVMLTFLLFLYINKEYSNKLIIANACGFSFAVSLSIEVIQLIFRKGTFQFADLLFNTLGGLLGGLAYILIKKLISKRKSG